MSTETNWYDKNKGETNFEITYLEYWECLITSGDIHAYVPAADIRVVL